MKYFPFSVGVGESTRIQARASYLRYYSVSAGAASPTLRIKTTSGLDVLLKPGQSLRLPLGITSSDWAISNHDAALTITGLLVLGDGQIDDDRITGSVTIDSVASITGTVSVAGTVITQEQGYAYGAAYSSNSVIAALGNSQVFAAASNLAGAIVHSVYLYSTSAGSPAITLLAKATAPASPIDGDIIIGVHGAAGAAVVANQLTAPVKIPSGKGLYFCSSPLETGANRGVLYTLL
jgi:hypothetical protein